MSNVQKTFCIWYEKLAAVHLNKRYPLSHLRPDGHIHGGLRMRLGDRMVPYLGYLSSDDVCFGQWLREFRLVAETFQSSERGRHVFDEGDQGQPAFVFERDGACAFFTIAPSAVSGAMGDPNWQRIEFSPTEFLSEYAGFRDAFFSDIVVAAPAVAQRWIQRHNAKHRRA